MFLVPHACMQSHFSRVLVPFKHPAKLWKKILKNHASLFKITGHSCSVPELQLGINEIQILRVLVTFFKIYRIQWHINAHEFYLVYPNSLGFIRFNCLLFGASHVALVVKNPPASAGGTRDSGLIPGLGRSPGEGNDNPLQYSCLENPMDRALAATFHRVATHQIWLKRLSMQHQLFEYGQKSLNCKIRLKHWIDKYDDSLRDLLQNCNTAF